MFTYKTEQKKTHTNIVPRSSLYSWTVHACKRKIFKRKIYLDARIDLFLLKGSDLCTPLHNSHTFLVYMQCRPNCLRDVVINAMNNTYKADVVT